MVQVLVSGGDAAEPPNQGCDEVERHALGKVGCGSLGANDLGAFFRTDNALVLLGVMNKGCRVFVVFAEEPGRIVHARGCDDVDAVGQNDRKDGRRRGSEGPEGGKEAWGG